MLVNNLILFLRRADVNSPAYCIEVDKYSSKYFNANLEYINGWQFLYVCIFVITWSFDCMLIISIICGC